MIKQNLQNATNVYRTKYFIVEQNIYIQFYQSKSNTLFSNDVYYLRTKERDARYEITYKSRKFIDGKRLHSSAYERKYIL